MKTWEWFLIGRYGGLAVIMGASWLYSRKWIPHKHTGYVSMSGHVWGCRRCGKKPETAQCELHGRYMAGTNCPMCPPPGYARCYSCGRDDVAIHTMRDGICIRCWLIMHPDAPRANADDLIT